MSQDKKETKKLLPLRGAVADTGMVSVRLTRVFNSGVTIELGVSYQAIYQSEEELSDIYADCLATLNNEMRVQVAKMIQSAQGMPSGAVGSSNTVTDANGHVLIDVIKIAVENKNGKKLYKVMGGKWEKYGVRLWLDPAVCSDELAEQIARGVPDENGFLKVPNCKATIEMNGEKPTRVMRIWRVQS